MKLVIHSAMLSTQSARLRALVLTLLIALALTPLTYAQQPPALTTAPQATAQESIDQQKLIAVEAFIRTELFFGRNKPDGTQVTKKEFASFLDEVITPLFPDGLTVLHGTGQFLNAQGNVEQERSVVLILLYSLADRRDKSAKIDEIRTAYLKRFQQQSVLRVDAPLPVWISF